MSAKLRYRRVVVKLSGEALCQPGEGGVETGALAAAAAELTEAAATGLQIAVVIGGGNFLRGRMLKDAPNVQRVSADYMGMLATVMNGLALRDALQACGTEAVVLSALPIEAVVEPVDIRKAIGHLEAGRIVILAGGTGRPFVTTDTCAALRACELQADALLKGTKVDGVFDNDPETDPNATRYDSLPYEKVLADRLGVMDAAAVSLCMDNGVPIVVYQMTQPDALKRIVQGEDLGTTIGD
jgi:uridylate kinase